MQQAMSLAPISAVSIIWSPQSSWQSLSALPLYHTPNFVNSCTVDHRQRLFPSLLHRHRAEEVTLARPFRGSKSDTQPDSSRPSVNRPLNMSETVVQNVTLFDGRATHSGATVTFNSSTGLITAVSTDNSSAETPSEATVIDGQGHTLLPGLIDAHIHCYGLHLPDGADLSSVLRDPLRCGVTTVCDMHSDTETVWDHQNRVKEELEQAKQDGKSGRVTMASLKSAHLGATIEGGWPKPIVLAGHATDEVRAEDHASWGIC